MLWKKNSEVTPGNYTGFLSLLSKHNLIPAKPIETFMDYKPNQFSLPDEVKGPSTLGIKIDGHPDLEFYAATPKMEQFEAYKGNKASASLKGGETAAFQVMEKYLKNT